MRRPRTWLVLYALLLAASHGVRRLGHGAPAAVGAGPAMMLEAVRPGAGVDDSGEARLLRGPERVRLAYADLAPTGDPARLGLPVVLLHGSPGSKDDFRGLLPTLRRCHRVLIPDLPGFGGSTRRIPDYSIRAQADYVAQWLRALDLERVHVVGFSMGGGVALELNAHEPELLASLSLLSALGAQEYELLGDYHLNHGLHSLQWAGLFTLEELVPHFGLLDGGALSLEYARNFLDTDQRPLREHLGRVDVPTLILHGRGDVLVPFAAALETRRLVPQSELVPFDGNHFLVFRRPGEVAEHLETFFEAVEAGEAPTRGDASPERIAAAERAFDPASIPPASGFALVVFCVLAALATFVSEDLTCIAVGTMVAQGRVPFLAGTLACLVGIWVGDLLLFVAGRMLGRRALAVWPLRRWLSEERVEASSRWLEERGAGVILASRFLPGARLPTYFAAGVLRTGFWRFNLWFLFAAVLWTPLIVYLSGRLGGGLVATLGPLGQHVWIVLLTTLFAVWVVVRLLVGVATARGRALLRGRWRRWVRWEYWPRPVVYAPVALAVLMHGLRRRRPLAFTAANPAIPLGGLAGESKAAILERIAAGPGAARVPRTLLVDGGSLAGDEGARRARVERFQQSLAQPWPLVVKPDVGERGEGVLVVRCPAELEAALAAQRGVTHVQEYCPGPEFGVFYSRIPGEPRGRLLSVSRKVPPRVVGDGRRTLERLILEDDRHVAMARALLARWATRLHEVPDAGEEVLLGDLGTHCRGAAFLDGRDLETPALADAVETLVPEGSGLFHGRFDIKAASEDAFRRGVFSVLELNGVTSEPAHIYDPAVGPVEGARELVRAWRRALDIGLENERRGVHVAGAVEILRGLLGARRRARARRLGPAGWREIPGTPERRARSGPETCCDA